MNGKLIVFLIQICSFCAKGFDQGDGLSSIENFRELTEYDEDGSFEFDYGTEISNVHLKHTMKKFQCGTDFTDSVVLVNGAKSWTFPRQDVNLTLTYPTAKYSAEYRNFVISGIQVTLLIDGEHSKGYITSGGMLQRSITLSFVSTKISTLSYNFKLYGTYTQYPDRGD